MERQGKLHLVAAKVIFYKNSKIRVNSKALIHHDSFFDGHLKDLIANSFRKTIFAHRFGKCQIDTELLETKNLSLVIQEMVERRFVVCVKK